MAGKKGRNGRVFDITARILTEIRDQLRDGFAAVNARLDQTNARLDQTNARLDNIRDLAGERYRDLDARVRALEALAKPTRSR